MDLISPLRPLGSICRLIVVVVMSLTVSPLAAQPSRANQDSISAAKKSPSPALTDELINTTFARLQTIWKEQESAVKTAAISFRSVRRAGRLLVENISRDEFRTRLSDVDLASKDDAFRDWMQSFTPPPYRKIPWVAKEFFLAGDRRRESSADTIQMVDGKFLICARKFIAPARQQIDLYPEGSALYTMRLTDFRFVPSPVLAKSVLEGRISAIRVHGKERQLSLLSKHKSGTSVELVIDESNGSLLELVVRDAKQNVSQETLQGGFRTDPKGVMYPAWHIRCDYRDNRLHYLDATVIDTATFNDPIPDDKFRVAAYSGDTIVDNGRGAGASMAERVSADIPDVQAASTAAP
ncbi:MAG TPA: hypothetical protein VG055_31950 [Planctomycetaceae bacterium]|jgi:hypothetical protein|nr:hypothetical protein [Planctomycetaceae bacterium]